MIEIIIVVKNEIRAKEITVSRNNMWAKERSKVISQYIMSEMLMNTKQATYLEQVLYEKYARNNEKNKRSRKKGSNEK